MSYISWDSENGSAEVKGIERHMANMLCVEMTAMMVSEPIRLLPLVSLKSNYRQFLLGTHVEDHEYAQRHDRFRSFLLGFEGGFVLADGTSISTFSVCLNTAYKLGSEVVRFLVRMHGQCEVHTYVEGGNRAWLAGIIERGRKEKIFRAEMGWEEVIELLKSRADGPVVMSYSVSEGFPDEDENLSLAERWKIGLELLRGEHLLEITPENWDSYSFWTCYTIMDLLEIAKSAGG